MLSNPATASRRSATPVHRVRRSRLRPWGLRLVALVFLVSFVACSGSGSDDDDGGPAPGLENPWEETTVPYDPDCASGCIELANDHYGHIGDVEWMVNPDVDDPIAQWGDCLQSFVDCMDGGGEPMACSQSSECPEACQREFSRRVEGVEDEEAQLDVFEAVYILDEAPCLPPLPASEGSGEVTP